MENYYFTFGSNHTLPNTVDFKDHPLQKRSLGRHYVTIEAENMGLARQTMLGRYGDKWAFCYPQEQFKEAIQQFNLTQIERLTQDNQP